MKKALSIILAAAMMMSASSLAFAAETPVDAETDVLLSTETEIEPVSEPETETEDADVELMATNDDYILEYDETASGELDRVVNVKYDQTYFTSGINSFVAEIYVPSQYVADVTAKTSGLVGFNFSQNEYNPATSTFTIAGTRPTNYKTSNGLLFTMTITLKDYITSPITIMTTGNTSMGDESIKHTLKNGMNVASVEIPKNKNDGHGTGSTDGAVTWTYANSVLTLSGNGTMDDYDMGKAPWIDRAKEIKSIVFTGDTLTNIGRYAFYGLYNVESVKFPAYVGTIGAGAFEGCSSLKGIDIPKQVSGIGNYAFKDCKALQDVVVPPSVRTIGLGAFVGCSSLKTITIPFIGSQVGSANNSDKFTYIFDNNPLQVPPSLKEVTVTNEDIVPAEAFKGCENIQYIYLNDSVQSIGNGAFMECKSLQSFGIPSGVSKIGDYMFQQCTSLTEVMGITDKITEIGAYAFDKCQSLKYINIPNIKVINGYTFRGCKSLTEIEIPNSVESIGKDILKDCTKLVDVKVPFVGSSIDPSSGEDVFGYFFGVANGNIPDSITKVEVTGTDRKQYIPEEAFANCANIEDLIIDGGRSVQDNAFKSCRALKNLYLPKSVSTIGKTILADCERLTTLAVPFIGSDRNDTNKETSVIGGFFGWNEMDGGAKTTKQYYNENGDYHFYKVPSTLKNVSILYQANIPAGALSECDFVENVTIVTGSKIGKWAFYHCASLKTVVLPNDMTVIDDQAFADCESLETINLPAKPKKITIGSLVFAGDTSLKNVTMPDNVTDIADDVFAGSALLMSADGDAPVNVLKMNGGVITCSQGSAADKYAQAHDIETNYVDSKLLDIQEIKPTIELHSDGKYYILAPVNPVDMSGTVYAALYDADDKMIAARAATTNTEDYSYGFEFSQEESSGFAKARVFVWDNKLMKSYTTTVAELTPADVSH